MRDEKTRLDAASQALLERVQQRSHSIDQALKVRDREARARREGAEEGSRCTWDRHGDCIGL